MNENATSKVRADKLTDFLLDVATFLLASGAHSGRVERNVKRMAEEWGFTVAINISFTGALISVEDKKDWNNRNTYFKKSPSHSVHFDIISKVSSLSWRVHDEHLSYEEAKKLFDEIKITKHYNPWVTCISVGFSCAGLCIFYGGDYTNAFIAFLAAFIGYRLRVFLSRMNYNILIVVTLAALLSTIITCLGGYWGLGNYPESAVATGVLYLIPGVPLINSVIDLIEGYTTSSVNRILFSGYNLLCIAVGMTICITAFGISNFV